jgi:hypothetical protein
MTTIHVPTPGFTRLKSVEPGSSTIAYLSKAGLTSEYIVGGLTTVTGFCKYGFLSSAGVIRGILIVSPKMHTTMTPTSVKIGPCEGPAFKLNTNLQQVGILMYESPDSGLLIIPVNVASPLLVEVET